MENKLYEKEISATNGCRPCQTTLKSLEKRAGCGVVAHERLTEPHVTVD